MIRTIATSFGPTYYAVCRECKTDEPVAAVGVHYSDDALPAMALPSGWLTITERDMRNRPVQFHYCPRCAVAPEYRRRV